ncbi:hypothetical protein JKP88DRAFT_336541 [Tribonema minus]|uniref:Uncharacterized protein n=1 Tax=Tribonema minus TaxID=303371 RepID=A0A836C982_9STRA|nr:hypothetical protein JKP88DRAFT_336541 [Tribonema minus]
MSDTGSAGSNDIASLEGRLFRYRPGLVAFQHGRHNDCLVLLGGLTDGPLSLKYSTALAAALDVQSWSLVLPTLSTSYLGYGVGSLTQDCDELVDLLSCLPAEGRIVLMGHSTGCQISVHFMKHAPQAARKRVAGVVLQAAVSDRDYLATLPQTQELVTLARTLPLTALMPREADIAPITAYRYLSLAARGGDDDMFSDDFSQEELKDRLGHMTVPTLLLASLADEYVPAGVDVSALVERIAGAMPGCRKCVRVAGGLHDLSGHIDVVAEETSAFLQTL